MSSFTNIPLGPPQDVPGMYVHVYVQKTRGNITKICLTYIKVEKKKWLQEKQGAETRQQNKPNARTLPISHPHLYRQAVGP